MMTEKDMKQTVAQLYGPGGRNQDVDLEWQERLEKKLTREHLVVLMSIVLIAVASMYTISQHAKAQVYSALNAVNAEVVSLQKYVIESTAVIRSSTDQVRKTEEEMEQAKGALKSGTDRLMELEKQLREGENALKSSKEELMAAQEELGKTRRHLESGDKSVEQAQRTLREIQRKFDASIEDLGRRISNLEDRVNSLK